MLIERIDANFTLMNNLNIFIKRYTDMQGL